MTAIASQAGNSTPTGGEGRNTDPYTKKTLYSVEVSSGHERQMQVLNKIHF